MNIKILLVEDDFRQAEWIEGRILERFQGAGIVRICTESEFRAYLPNIANLPPDIIIIDMMLRWQDPAPERIPMPGDVEQEGIYLAGFRCQRLISSEKITRDIPVILYTVMEDSDLKLKSLPPNVYYVQKDSDSRTILDKIADVLSQRAKKIV